jgi:hypothetical protein
LAEFSIPTVSDVSPETRFNEPVVSVPLESWILGVFLLTVNVVALLVLAL